MKFIKMIDTGRALWRDEATGQHVTTQYVESMSCLTSAPREECFVHLATEDGEIVARQGMLASVHKPYPASKLTSGIEYLALRCVAGKALWHVAAIKAIDPWLLPHYARAEKEEA